MSVVVDASVLVAHLSALDAHHTSADRLLEALGGAELLAHPMTLAAVLVGGARADRAEEMAADLRALGVHQAVPDEQQPLRLARLRVDTQLKLPDCCVLDTALHTRTDLATFDAALAAAARSLRVTVQR